MFPLVVFSSSEQMLATGQMLAFLSIKRADFGQNAPILTLSTHDEDCSDPYNCLDMSEMIVAYHLYPFLPFNNDVRLLK